MSGVESAVAAHGSAEHLVQMANDIGNFFRSDPVRADGIAGIAGSPAELNAVLFQGNGSIVTAGFLTTQPAPSGSPLTELAILRYTASGVPDTPFGTGGGAFAPPAFVVATKP